MSESASTVEAHARRFFKGHAAEVKVWPRGAMLRSYPSFHVLEFAPGPRSGLWTYVSVGAFDFHLLTMPGWSSCCALIARWSAPSSS